MSDKSATTNNATYGATDKRALPTPMARQRLAAAKRLQVASGGRLEFVSAEPGQADPKGEAKSSALAQFEQAQVSSDNSKLSPLPSKQQANIQTLKQQDPNSHANIETDSNGSVDTDPNLQQPTRPYPKKVLFIVANEFCERFSYYGLRTVLVLYFQRVLGFTDTNSTVSFHLFAALCYLTPILGAILGDSVWGKYKTILYLSVVYFIGELVLVVSALIWDWGAAAPIATFAGLLLIGVGTGGIKPCVSALGGDQFELNESKWRQTFFSLFYAAINLGSLISMFLTPLLRSNFSCARRADCFPLAFGVPCALMFIAIVVFLCARNQYTLHPLPERNVMVALCQCVWLALKRRLFSPDPRRGSSDTDAQAIVIARRAPSSDLSDAETAYSEDLPAIKTSGPADISGLQKSDRALVAKNNSSSKRRSGKKDSTGEDRHWLYLASDRFSADQIDDFRSALGTVLIMLPLPVYWCLFDQQSSLWTLQATRMDGRVFGSKWVLQPDQMGVANPLLLLVSIPLFELLIYPALSSCNLLTRPLQRMSAGGILAALAFVSSALIELRIQQFTPTGAPAEGRSSLLLVNGLLDCSLVEPMISYNQRMLQRKSVSQNTDLPGNNISTMPPIETAPLRSVIAATQLEPLIASQIELDALDTKSNKLSVSSSIGRTTEPANATAHGAYELSFALANSTNITYQSSVRPTCALGPGTKHLLLLDAFNSSSAHLLYLQQGNGRVKTTLLNDSLAMPGPGRARVRLLYEPFGSTAAALKRRFALEPLSQAEEKTDSARQKVFEDPVWQDRVMMTSYLDVQVPSMGAQYRLIILGDTPASHSDLMAPNVTLLLKPGTRNLLVLNQRDAHTLELAHNLLQDNEYRISMLYQLAPYMLISMSEVMFSITGLEFSYSMAPDSMKSVILGLWSLTTAFGNLLTIAIESMHIFDNMAYDFLFYASIMALDMLLFAFIARRYYPSETSRRDSGRMPKVGRAVEHLRKSASFAERIGLAEREGVPPVRSPNKY